MVEEPEYAVLNDNEASISADESGGLEVCGTPRVAFW